MAAEPPGTSPIRAGASLSIWATLTNPGPANATLTLRYTAVVIDNPENVRGVSLNNRVTWNWVGGQLIDSADDVVLVEPTLTLGEGRRPALRAARRRGDVHADHQPTVRRRATVRRSSSS